MKPRKPYRKPKIKFVRRIEAFAVVCGHDPQSKNYYSELNRTKKPCRRVFS
jgi:hypothetical protein